MAEPEVAAYGSWKSPITSDVIVSESVRLGQLTLDGDDIYWIEMRPAEGGRNVIVRWTPGRGATEITPSPYNARTRVHEYGGGDFLVADGVVYFSNFADQRLYRQDPAHEPRPVTPEADMRYADGVLDRLRDRIICVREDHSVAEREAFNTLVGINTDGDDCGQVLVSGHDFYSSPRLSPDGSRLAWLAWNHPNMPWDGTELWVGEIGADGTIGRSERIVGGVSESVFQPEWSPDGTLYFVSDRSEWWNLYRWREGSIEPLIQMEAEFGRPQWLLGMMNYSFESAHRMVCAYTQKGTWHLATIDTAMRKLEPIELPYTDISFVRTAPGRAVLNAGSPTELPSIVQLDLITRRLEVLRRSGAVSVDAGYLSSPQAIEFPTRHGQKAHALFYPPKNSQCIAPSGERPPLLVISHGGPTSATSSSLDLRIQYWTSRGIAVLDVNYGGSSGYGRSYRQRLQGNWGVVDVDDCVNGARHLIEQGMVNGDRLAIRGGSAGGYTTLCALTFRDMFKAGASYYGVSDLEALARETHKFESHYLDGLVGPYPELRDVYRERSPINFTHRLSCPLIVFQGLEDRIVPPNQAELMVDALREKGLPVAYVAFEGEQHGFRRANSMKRALDAELYFYSRVFGFELPEAVEPVPIENL